MRYKPSELDYALFDAEVEVQASLNVGPDGCRMAINFLIGGLTLLLMVAVLVIAFVVR